MPTNTHKIGNQFEKQPQLVLQTQHQLEQQAAFQDKLDSTKNQNLVHPLTLSSSATSKHPIKKAINQTYFDPTLANTPPDFASIPYSSTLANNNNNDSLTTGSSSDLHLSPRTNKNQSLIKYQKSNRPFSSEFSGSPSSTNNPGCLPHPVKFFPNPLEHLSLSLSAASFFCSSSSEDESDQEFEQSSSYYYGNSFSGLKAFKGQGRRDRRSRLPLSSIPTKPEEQVEEIDQTHELKKSKHRLQSSVMFFDGIIPKAKKKVGQFDTDTAAGSNSSSMNTQPMFFHTEPFKSNQSNGQPFEFSGPLNNQTLSRHKTNSLQFPGPFLPDNADSFNFVSEGFGSNHKSHLPHNGSKDDIHLGSQVSLKLSLGQQKDLISKRRYTMSCISSPSSPSEQSFDMQVPSFRYSQSSLQNTQTLPSSQCTYQYLASLSTPPEKLSQKQKRRNRQSRASSNFSYSPSYRLSHSSRPVSGAYEASSNHAINGQEYSGTGQPKSSRPEIFHVPSPIRAAPHPALLFGSKNEYNNTNSYNIRHSNARPDSGKRFNLNDVGNEYSLKSLANGNEMFDMCGGRPVEHCFGEAYSEDTKLSTSQFATNTSLKFDNHLAQTGQSGSGEHTGMAESIYMPQHDPSSHFSNGGSLSLPTTTNCNNNIVGISKPQSYNNSQYSENHFRHSSSSFPQSLSPPPSFPLPDPLLHSSSCPESAKRLSFLISPAPNASHIGPLNCELSPAATSTPINIPKSRSPNYFNTSLIHMGHLGSSPGNKHHRHTISVDTQPCEMNGLMGSIRLEKEQQRQEKVHTPKDNDNRRPIYKRLETAPVMSSADGMSHSSSVPIGSLSVAVTVLEPVGAAAVPAHSLNTTPEALSTDSSRKKRFTKRFSGLYLFGGHVHEKEDVDGGHSSTAENAQELKDEETSPVMVEERVLQVLIPERSADSPVGGSSSDNKGGSLVSSSESESPCSFKNKFEDQPKNMTDLAFSANTSLLVPNNSTGAVLGPTEGLSVSAIGVSHHRPQPFARPTAQNCAWISTRSEDNNDDSNDSEGFCYASDREGKESKTPLLRKAEQRRKHRVTRSESSQDLVERINKGVQNRLQHSRAVSGSGNFELYNNSLRKNPAIPPIPPRSANRVLHQNRIRSIISQNSAPNTDINPRMGIYNHNHSNSNSTNSSAETEIDVTPLHISKKASWDDNSLCAMEPQVVTHSPPPETLSKTHFKTWRQSSSNRTSIISITSNKSFDDVLKSFINEDLKFFDDFDTSLGQLEISFPDNITTNTNTNAVPSTPTVSSPSFITTGSTCSTKHSPFSPIIPSTPPVSFISSASKNISPPTNYTSSNAITHKQNSFNGMYYDSFFHFFSFMFSPFFFFFSWSFLVFQTLDFVFLFHVCCEC